MTKRIDPRIILLFGVMATSTSSIFARYSDAPALIISLYRLGWSVLLLLPSVMRSYLPELRAVSKKDKAVCIAGGAFLAMHFWLWFESLRLTTIVSASVIISTEVIFAAIGFCLFMNGRIPPMAVAAIAVTLSGTILTALSGGGEGTNLVGNLICLVSAASMSVYTLIGRAMRMRMSTTAYTFLVYLSCMTVLGIMCLATKTPVTGYAPKELLIGLLMAVFCTLLGHSVFSWALKYFTPAFVSATKLSGPVFAAAMAFLLFREAPTIIEVWGCAVTLGGVLLYCRIEQREAELSGTKEAEEVKAIE